LVLSPRLRRIGTCPRTALCDGVVEWCMARKQEAVDNLLDALVWMRRKSKKREPVDALIDELVKMRRKTKKKATKRKTRKKTKKAR
jgi:hypothetical protein